MFGNACVKILHLASELLPITLGTNGGTYALLRVFAQKGGSRDAFVNNYASRHRAKKLGKFSKLIVESIHRQGPSDWRRRSAEKMLAHPRPALFKMVPEVGSDFLAKLYGGDSVGLVEHDDNVFGAEFRDSLHESVEVVLPLGIRGVENADKNVREAENAVEDGGIGGTFGAVGVRRVHEDRFRQSRFRNGNDVERVLAEPPDNLVGIAHAADDGGRLARRWPIHACPDGILTAAERVHEGRLASSRAADNGDDGFGIELLFKCVNVAQRLVERGGKILAMRPVRTGFKLALELRQPPPLFCKTGQAQYFRGWANVDCVAIVVHYVLRVVRRALHC